MDNCVQQRRLLAQEFKAVRNSFLALGDENRQQVFLVILKANRLASAWEKSSDKRICPVLQCPIICEFSETQI